MPKNFQLSELQNPHYQSSRTHRSDVSVPESSLQIDYTLGSDAALTPSSVLNLQRTRGNQAVQRILAQRVPDLSARRIQRHKTRRTHPHPHPTPTGQQSSKMKTGIESLDLVGNSATIGSEALKTIKPVSEMLGAGAGMGMGMMDVLDPEKDKTEKTLGGLGSMTSAVQLGSQIPQVGGLASTVSGYLPSMMTDYLPSLSEAGSMAGETVMPGLDVIGGAYKTGKGLWNRSSGLAAQKKVKNFISSGAPGKTVLINAAKILEEIVEYKLKLDSWDSGTGALTTTGAGMALGGALTVNPLLTTVGTVIGGTGKVLGSDLLWKGLQWMTGDSVWSGDRYKEEIKMLEEKLTNMIDSIVNTNNSNLKQLAALYECAQEISPDFAKALRSKIFTTRATTSKQQQMFPE